MRSFFHELARDPSRTITLIVMDESGMEQPRRHRLRPRDLFISWAASALLVALLLLTFLVLTPLRTWIPGYGTSEMRQQARLTSLRLTALQDSLTAQQQYVTHLRNLMIGQPDPSGGSAPIDAPVSSSSELVDVASTPGSEDWADHQQPAVPLSRLPVDVEQALNNLSAGEKYLSSLQFPLLPPVNGYLTNGFDALTGHYAVDLAVDEGTVVRAIGDGHVIFADWTHEGGFVLIIQHADGYASVYKHNQRLLKQVGDRVHDREAIAMSGDSGEVTTGPHLHFELWHHGLAQDPRAFLIGA
jgi:murein DD-endopeptidase MepM/ murein hydrolase activator NlpD